MAYNDSPFSITFGQEPQNYIDRSDEKTHIIQDFSSNKPVSSVYLITGSRGSGKTVFLSQISEYFSKENDWIVVDPGTKDNILANIAAGLYSSGRVKHLFKETEFSFSFQGFGISIKGKEPVTSILVLLQKIFEHLQKKGEKVLITIDEVDNSPQMKTFFEAYQYFLRLKYDVRLLMTGLYENVSKVMDEKSLTFLYRSPSIQLGPLDIRLVSANYQELLHVDGKLAISLAKETKGFAYAYQLLGQLFYESEEKTITPTLLSRYDQYLAKYVYDKVYSGMTENEKKVVSSFSTEKAIKVSLLAERTGFPNKTLSVYRDRLIKKGVILSPKYGYLAFALPRFSKYLENLENDFNYW